jgi:signal transduction histidine kinase
MGNGADREFGGVIRRSLLSSRRSPTLGLAASALTVVTATLVVYPLQTLDPGVSSGVLYLLGVLLISVHWGFRLGLFTSVGGALALEYFHSPPTGSFVGKNADDLVAISVLLLTATVASAIADRARARAEDAEERLQLEEQLRRRDAERIRMEELRASRMRMVAAADEARRRLERDLHDGGQQRLVHTVITLKLALRALEERDDGAEDLVRQALGHAEHATAELRELAHGILPSTLARGGLRAGVESCVARMSLPVTVDVSGERFPPGIEATAYFVVSEALTNAAKHSGADRVEVSARSASGLLRIEVRDDGVGGADLDAGTGLLGLHDRVAALDGQLQVASPPGEGTAVLAKLPLIG